MKTFLLTIFFVLSLVSHASAAYIQSNYTDAFPVTQESVAFSNPVTAGSLLVLAVRMSNGGVATSVTSTGGSVWTLDRRQMSDLDWSFEVWSLPNAPAGARLACRGKWEELMSLSKLCRRGDNHVATNADS